MTFYYRGPTLEARFMYKLGFGLLMHPPPSGVGVFRTKQ